MLNLVKIEKDEYGEIQSVVDHINNNYDKKDGDYYYFNYNDDYKILYKCNNVYVIYSYNKEQDNITYTIFVYSEEDQQIYVNFGSYILHMSEQGEALEDKNGILHYLNIIKSEDINGYAYYSQHDLEKDILLVQFYDHHFMVDKDKKQRIYHMRLHNPAKIIIRNKANKKMNKPFLPYNSIMYAKLQYNDVNGSILYNLFKNEANDKYYRIYGMLPNGKLLPFPFLTNGLNDNEMEDLIKSYGFSVDVPNLLVDYYNGEVLDTSFYWDLVKEEKILSNKGRCLK